MEPELKGQGHIGIEATPTPLRLISLIGWVMFQRWLFCKFSCYYSMVHILFLTILSLFLVKMFR